MKNLIKSEMTTNPTPSVQTCKISVDKSGNGSIKIPKDVLCMGDLDAEEFVFFEKKSSSMVVTPTKYYKL